MRWAAALYAAAAGGALWVGGGLHGSCTNRLGFRDWHAHCLMPCKPSHTLQAPRRWAAWRLSAYSRSCAPSCASPPAWRSPSSWLRKASGLGGGEPQCGRRTTPLGVQPAEGCWLSCYAAQGVQACPEEASPCTTLLPFANASQASCRRCTCCLTPLSSGMAFGSGPRMWWLLSPSS